MTTASASACQAGAGMTSSLRSGGSKTIFLGESEHHGIGGRLADRSPKACPGPFWTRSAMPRKKLGIRKIPDFNTGDNEGVGYFHVNQKARDAAGRRREVF